jgi:hypothetical protein
MALPPHDFGAPSPRHFDKPPSRDVNAASPGYDGPPPPLPESLDISPPALPPPLTVRTAVVHIAVLATVGLLFLKIVPAFTKIFKDFDATLPGMTIVMIDASNWFKNYWYLAVLLLPLYFGGLYYVGVAAKEAQRTWTSFLVIFVVLLVLFAVFAMFLPLVTLIEKLS